MPAPIHGQDVDPVWMKLVGRTPHDCLPDLSSHVSVVVQLKHIPTDRLVAPSALFAVTVGATDCSGVDMVNGCALSYAGRDDRRLEFDAHADLRDWSSA